MSTGTSVERDTQKAGKRLSKGLEDASYTVRYSLQIATSSRSSRSPPFGVSALFYILSVPPPPAVSCIVTRVSSSTRSTPAGQDRKCDILCIRSVRLARSSLFELFQVIFSSHLSFRYVLLFPRCFLIPIRPLCNCDLHGDSYS